MVSIKPLHDRVVVELILNEGEVLSVINESK